jgi:cephalosporin hydroxylase
MGDQKPPRGHSQPQKNGVGIMAAVKNSYSGKFNLSGEVIDETADAYSEEQAKLFMSQKIALKARVFPSVVWNYLETHPNSYEIKMVS